MNFKQHSNSGRRDVVLLSIHFFLSLVTLLFLISFLSAKVGVLIGSHFNISISYLPWSRAALAIKKPANLVEYFLIAVSVFVYLGLLVLTVFRSGMLHFSRFSNLYSKQKEWFLWIVFGLVLSNLVLIFLSLKITKLSELLVLGAIWVFLLLFPFQGIFEKIADYMTRFFTKTSLFLLILVGLVIMTLAFLPYVQGSQLKVSNDFLDAPETTILNGHPVNNIAYIDRHHIAGFFLDGKVVSKKLLPRKGYYAAVPDNTGLDEYIAAFPNEYAYDHKRDILIFRVPPNNTEVQAICQVLDKVDCFKLAPLTGKHIHYYTPSDVQFFMDNAYELGNQILAGHYFHHQYAMLGPVNEILLGKPESKIMFLYGWGNAHFFASISKWFGALSFEKFIALLYPFYWLYFGVFVLSFAWLFFRDLKVLAFVFTISTALLLLTGFESLRLAPGFNPIRHLFDLPAIGLFYGYLVAKRRNMLYLVAALVLTMLSIIASQQFGWMLFLAVAGAAILNVILTKRRSYGLLIPVLLFLVFVGFCHYIPQESDPTGIYNFLGVSVAPTYIGLLGGLAVFILLGYSVIFFVGYSRGKNYPRLYLMLLFFFYTQEVLIYYVWYSEPGHLLSTSTIWIFCTTFMLKELLDIVLPKAKRNIWSFMVFLSILMLAIGTFFYFMQEKKYLEIFKDHLVYHWDLKRAHFLSTADPKPFQEAVSLIQQYDHQPSIYIISQYDPLLPFLSDKYSAMPYIELAPYLVSFKEIQATIHLIAKDKPKYIFADTDIMSSHIGEVADSKDQIGQRLDSSKLSYGRVLELDALRKVFGVVEKDYVPVKTGFLLTVYERKSDLGKDVSS